MYCLLNNLNGHLTYLKSCISLNKLNDHLKSCISGRHYTLSRWNASLKKSKYVFLVQNLCSVFSNDIEAWINRTPIKYVYENEHEDASVKIMKKKIPVIINNLKKMKVELLIKVKKTLNIGDFHHTLHHYISKIISTQITKLIITFVLMIE